MAATVLAVLWHAACLGTHGVDASFAYFTLPRIPAEPPLTLAYAAAGHTVSGVPETVAFHYIIRDAVSPFCFPTAHVVNPDGTDVGKYPLNTTARAVIRFEARQAGNFRVSLSLLCTSFAFLTGAQSHGNVTMDAYFEGLDPMLGTPLGALDLVSLAEATAASGPGNDSAWADMPVLASERDARRVEEFVEELDGLIPAFFLASNDFLQARPEFHAAVVALHRRVVVGCTVVTAIFIATTALQTWQLRRVFQERKVV